jgi:hypothetical protein
MTIGISIMEARPNYPVTTAIAASGVGPSNFVARFGWKSALLAFSGNAYLNEIGITNRISFSETHFLTAVDFVAPQSTRLFWVLSPFVYACPFRSLSRRHQVKVGASSCAW